MKNGSLRHCTAAPRHHGTALSMIQRHGGWIQIDSNEFKYSKQLTNESTNKSQSPEIPWFPWTSHGRPTSHLFWPARSRTSCLGGMACSRNTLSASPHRGAAPRRTRRTRHGDVMGWSDNDLLRLWFLTFKISELRFVTGIYIYIYYIIIYLYHKTSQIIYPIVSTFLLLTLSEISQVEPGNGPQWTDHVHGQGLETQIGIWDIAEWYSPN